MSAAALFLSLRLDRQEAQLEEQLPITFQYGDRTLVAQEGVPVTPMTGTPLSWTTGGG